MKESFGVTTRIFVTVSLLFMLSLLWLASLETATVRQVLILQQNKKNYIRDVEDVEIIHVPKEVEELVELPVLPVEAIVNEPEPEPIYVSKPIINVIRGSNWPVVPGNLSSPISSKFGWRLNPFTKKSEHHHGIDIPAPYGSDVYAFDSGRVVALASSIHWTYGIGLIIDHENGMSTLYAHNSSLVVAVGDYVNKGDVIAKVGSTGASTGNHLHFEVKVDGVRQDPELYLD